MASDLDRVDQHRASTDWVSGLWRAEDAKLLKLDAQSRFTTNVGGSKLRMTRPFVEFDSQRHRLLGLLDGSPIFAVEALTEGEVHDFREVGALLTDNERDIAATATALTQWHRMEPMCPTCGEQTKVINGGFARHCLTCGHDHFPRTDPAVIVAVLDDEDRILLGRQATWPARRVSILAGFVEAGESLEQAIHREIAEEVDVSLSTVQYYGSQPWPFPRSLMFGFAARATSTAICVDGQEIEVASWFTRDQVRSQVASGELGLPGASSIAYRLIEAWLNGELTV
ncbi:MAG: NAD(+) diphosphatase [Propionibacteriaceae bacterium]